MPAQANIIKDHEVIVDTWRLINDETELETTNLSEDDVIIPFSIWQTQPELKTKPNVAVWLSNDVNLSEIAEELTNLPLIGIHFPGFMDGRGFSLARLLRERYRYEGEIRAIGHIIRDQLCYLKRCGFNAFTFDEDVDVHAALESLNDFTEAYQTSVDQPSPLFRRRAS